LRFKKHAQDGCGSKRFAQSLREFLTVWRRAAAPFALLKELAQNGHVEATRIPDFVSRHERALCASQETRARRLR